MPASFDRYADLETYLFGDVGREFQELGVLRPSDFLATLAWKSNRAVERHVERFVSMGESLHTATAGIARALQQAATPYDRLRSLMLDWGFRLPTASAILTVLYPEEFTVYDVRVCQQIRRRSAQEFSQLANWRFSERLWRGYTAFRAAAEAAVPRDFRGNLRTVDRYLWGEDWYETSFEKHRWRALAAIATRIELGEPFLDEESGVYRSLGQDVRRLADEDWVHHDEGDGWSNWAEWSNTHEGRTLLGGQAINQANHEQIARLMSFFSRAEHWETPALREAYRNGVLLAVARRAGALIGSVN